MARILVADDDFLLGDLLKFHLTAAGHQVEQADNGQQALDMIQRARPDIVILDQMMPIVSGQEVLRRLKADAKMQGLPVVMLTARKAQEDVVSALQLGADDYVTKPFMPEELLQRIRAILLRSPV